MIHAVSSEKAREKRVHYSFHGLLPEDKGVHHTAYLGYSRLFDKGEPPSSDVEHPIAFLVEQDPDTVIRAHYHAVNQWQVVVGGGGKLGGHALSGGVALHFSGPYSPYGPIDAGHQGINYFTLRKNYDKGARYLPESIPELRDTRTAKPRQAMAGPMPYLSGAELAGLKAAHTEILVALEADGVAAWRHQIPPGQSVKGSNPQAGGGQYWLVVAGSLEQQGETLPVNSCVFVESGEEAFLAKAGPAGLDVLEMQFPSGA